MPGMQQIKAAICENHPTRTAFVASEQLYQFVSRNNASHRCVMNAVARQRDQIPNTNTRLSPLLEGPSDRRWVYTRAALLSWIAPRRPFTTPSDLMPTDSLRHQSTM